jgi:hypothetical protein
MVSCSNNWKNNTSKNDCNAHIYCRSQAWIKDDEENACALMQNSLLMKRNPSNTNVYIKFLCYYGPALTGTSFWNNNKTTKSINELLTISDEAFIHLCIINYSATWKAQEKKKDGDDTVQIPVSIVYRIFYNA